jgi:hypothetical protein
MQQLMIVRRGQLDRFLSLQETFGRDPLRVEIIWDRRQGDRRRAAPSATSGDRRRRDRRGPPPSSWSALDFLVAKPGPTNGNGDRQAAAAQPSPGDVLIRREVGRNGPCTINRIPDGGSTLHPSYEVAVRHADAIAARAAVDLWYTEDDERFASVRRYRP